MEEQKAIEKKTPEKSEAAKKWDMVKWGLLSIWVGIALLVKFGVGVTMLVTGIIILVTQVVRKSVGLKLEGLWILVSVLFLFGGLWELFSPALRLVPILLILAGALLLVSVLGRKGEKKK